MPSILNKDQYHSFIHFIYSSIGDHYESVKISEQLNMQDMIKADT